MNSILVHSAMAEAFIILLLQQRQERQEDDYCATPQPKWQCWKNRSVFESFDFFFILKKTRLILQKNHSELSFEITL